MCQQSIDQSINQLICTLTD